MKLADFDFTVPVAGLLAGVTLLALVRAPAAAPAEPRALAVSSSRLGAISGVVIDSHGDAIPGVRVSVLAEDGSIVSETRTGSGGESVALGEFRVDQLPRGTYEVRATVADAKASAGLPRVPVSAWEDTRVRITLDLGY